MKYLLGIGLLLTLLSSCTKEEYVDNMPIVIVYREDEELLEKAVAKSHPDWVYIPPVAEPIEQDTPCTPILYTDPPFVTGWWYIPMTLIGNIEICVHPHCVVVPAGTDVTNILDSLLNEYDPNYSYEVYSNDLQTVSFIAKGSNDHEHFHGEVWIRPESINSGWGFQCSPQSYAFVGSMTFEEHLAAIENYPSGNFITFRLLNWTADQYIKAALMCIQCRIGRDVIDFKGIVLDTGEPFTMPDSIITMAIDAGWDDVRY